MAQVLDKDPRPSYVQIADDLHDQIANGQLQPGDRLPSVRLLAEQYDVAQMTVWQAINSLKQAGYLVSWKGRGVFVAEAPGQDVHAEDDSELVGRLDAIIDRLAVLEGRVDALEAKRPPGARRAQSTE